MPDVLVSGSDRRRRLPARWALRAVAALVAIVAALVVSIRQYDGNHARDLAYARAVHLTTVAGPAQGGTSTGAVLSLLNVGSVSVTVLSVVVDRPGYPADLRHQPLPAGASVTVHVPFPTCSPGVLTSPPDSIVVTLAARGAQTRNVIDLSPDAYAAVDRAVRSRCGYLPGDEAFILRDVTTVRRGAQVVVHARAYDNSLLPLTFDRLIASPGLSITTTPALPIALPVETHPLEPTKGVDVVITVSVRSCQTYARTGSVGSVWVVRGATLYDFPVPLRPAEVLLSAMCS